MAQRFFTADFHLGSSQLLNKSLVKTNFRDFETIDDMNSHLIETCNNIAKPEDIIIHVGDFCSYKQDRGHIGLLKNPITYIKQIDATFVNLQGNHDISNRVKSIGVSMRTSIGRFSDVSISHYPSYERKAIGHFIPGDIHLCGHVHNSWKYFIDKKNNVLNINVGVDVWNYRIVSEQELIDYIEQILKMHH